MTLEERVAALEEALAAHVGDKTALVHRQTPQEYEAAVVAKVDASVGVIDEDNTPNRRGHKRFMGMNPPQLYLMPGVTGDAYIDNANRENAVWNAYQRRKWEETHGPLCKRCQQDPHTTWCTS